MANFDNDLKLGLDLLEELTKNRLLSLSENTPFDDSLEYKKRAASLTLLKDHELNYPQIIFLFTALAPHLRPDFFDQVFAKHLPEAGDFPQLGGARGRQFRGFLPTAETVLFLLSQNDISQRLKLFSLFEKTNPLVRSHLITVEPPPAGEPISCGKLLVADELLAELTHGEKIPPRFGFDFPATRIETERQWSELVVSRQTENQLLELKEWLKYRDTLLIDWGMKRVFSRGYRILFHGPPGTGKTLTASLLAKSTGHDVYRIDLSTIVSKYIGETEKNLERVFEHAENKDWILFFDEADALFGKRTGVRDAHDRFANQEVSYLLQRLEQFQGVVILASNLKHNIDDAFLRRFQSVIHFNKPGSEERLRIWNNLMPPQVTLSPDMNLESICRRYELTGSNITNVMQYCLIRTLAKGDQHLGHGDVIHAIEREFQKEGRDA